jgi:predicted O-linked N-acetylglucosamine transferase (SPINDLY family)
MSVKTLFVQPAEENLQALLNAYQANQYAETEQLARAFNVQFPGHALAWRILGNVCIAQSRYQDALEPLQRVLAIEPNDHVAELNLGLVLTSLNDLLGAEAHIRTAIELAPKYGKAYVNLGMLLRLQGQFHESESACRRALEIDPCDASAHIQLGNALEDQGRLSEAQASYYRADMAHEPRKAVAHSNVLYLLNHDVFVNPKHLFAEHVAFGDQFEKPLRQHWPEYKNTKDKLRTLNVGFVSGDLNHHALANFLLPVFHQLGMDPSLALHAYYTHTVEDAVTQRMRPCFAQWHAVADLDDVELSHQIRNDNIDILFDLAGHTKNNRLLTFARKPAPVQISWLGYLGTTGLQAVDYYLCDPYWIPPGQLDWQFTEKLAYLPAAITFKPSDLAPWISPLPALQDGFITFGSFNRHSKINDSVIALWSLLLSNVPNSRLVMGAIPTERQAQLIQSFAGAGIEEGRITFFPRTDDAHYQALHRQVDFCLDTFPHGGGATAAHAAWMGLPTLSLAGETPSSRLSATLMHHLDLDSFVASSIDEFLAQGMYWSTHTTELAEIREGMRRRFRSSPIGNAHVFSKNLSDLLRNMWKTWCDGTAYDLQNRNLNSP